MVHNTASNGQWFTSYNCQKRNWFAETEIWEDHTFRHKSGIWQNFTMTTPETLNTEIAINELSFQVVTHTAYSATRFDSYRILKLGQGAEYFLDRLVTQMNDQVLQTYKHET
jgi:hypothetical protein